jgi:hypothetical protein
VGRCLPSATYAHASEILRAKVAAYKRKKQRPDRGAAISTRTCSGITRVAGFLKSFQSPRRNTTPLKPHGKPGRAEQGLDRPPQP